MTLFVVNARLRSSCAKAIKSATVVVQLLRTCDSATMNSKAFHLKSKKEQWDPGPRWIYTGFKYPVRNAHIPHRTLAECHFLEIQYQQQSDLVDSPNYHPVQTDHRTSKYTHNMHITHNRSVWVVVWKTHPAILVRICIKWIFSERGTNKHLSRVQSNCTNCCCVSIHHSLNCK